MLSFYTPYKTHICCPSCHESLNIADNLESSCGNCNISYPARLNRLCLIPSLNHSTNKSANKSWLNLLLNRAEALYVRSIFSPMFWSNLKIDNFIRSSSLQVDHSIIEIGSGDQKRKRFFKKHYFSIDHPTGQDFTPSSHIPDLWANAQQLPFKDNSLKSILSSFVIEHVKEPHKMIKEISRVLKVGGHLILIGPGDLCMTHGDPDNYYNLTRYAYYDLFQKNKLKIIREYVPAKTMVTALQIVYDKLTRNDFYNKHLLLKLLQILIIAITAIPIALLSTIANLLDIIIPDDKRGYHCICFLVQKY